MSRTAPHLFLIFDRNGGIDLPGSLRDDERIVSLSLLEVSFPDILPSDGNAGFLPDGPSFSRWCNRNHYNFCGWGEGTAQVEVATPEIAAFAKSAHALYGATDVRILSQWMAVHEQADGWDSWTRVERRLAGIGMSAG